MVLDRARDEDDPLAQQPRIDVEAALAPVGLLDDDGNELRNDVLMVDHGMADPLYAGASLHRRETRKVQGGEGRPHLPDRASPSANIHAGATVRAAHFWTARLLPNESA